MKYNISNKTNISCIITLIPENEGEENLVKNIRDEFTLLHHYNTVLKKHVNPYAEFLHFLDDTQFPSPVTVKYQVAKGIGL
jgi:hypothetical protein